jgi:hypothetical protein
MRFIYLGGIAFCAFLVGCDEASLMRKWTPPGAQSAAQGYVELLRQGQFDHIEHDSDPSIVDSHFRDTLAKMAAIFPAETPQSIKVVGAHVFHGPEYSTTDITLEYQFPGKWLLAQITTQQKGAVSSIVGFHVNLIPDSLENLNKFTLAGKSPTQYLTLICSVSSLLFALYVFVQCIRSKDMKPKWLWAIIVLVGVGKFAVNWGTGQWAYQLLAIQIPCFSMTRPIYGPWVVAAYLPVGAIVFLHRRWKKKITGETIPPSVHPLEGNATST